MNRQTAIHLFLVALLCFSQFVGTVHIVGHLHADAPDLAQWGQRELRDDCETAHALGLPHPPHGAAVDSPLRSHTHTSVDDADRDWSDCAIFHAFVGLSALLSGEIPDVFWQMQPALSETLKSDVVPTLVTDAHRIRGPPAYS